MVENVHICNSLKLEIADRVVLRARRIAQHPVSVAVQMVRFTYT
jgi:hypothetical protein